MRTNENLDIYICAHRNHEYWPSDKVYKIISSKKIDFVTDLDVIYTEDTKDSEDWITNGAFSELSMYYHVYKNMQIKDYIGFCHYRRYFDFGENNINQSIPNIDCIFNSCDAILPEPINVGNVYYNYMAFHNIKDLDICCDIIAENFPEYNEYLSIAMNEQWLIPHNMFIFKKQDFLCYCRFMFGVLFRWCEINNLNKQDKNSFINHVEQNFDEYCKHKISFGGKIEYQARIPSFLSERLMGVFILKHFKQPKYIKEHTLQVSDNVYNK